MKTYVLSNMECWKRSVYDEILRFLNEQSMVGEFFKYIGMEVQFKWKKSQTAVDDKRCTLNALKRAGGDVISISKFDTFYDLFNEDDFEKQKGMRNEGLMFLIIALFAITSVSIIGAVIFLIVKQQQRRKNLRVFIKELEHDNSNRWKTSNLFVINEFKQFNEDGPPDEWEMEGKNVLIFRNDLLGSGAFAFVYRGKLLNCRNSPFFEKSIKFVSHQTEADNDVALKVPRNKYNSGFWREVDLMKKIGFHQHFVNFIGYVRNVDTPCLILEYCTFGDLSNILAQNRLFLLSEVPNEGVETNPNIRLDINLLISFAWQISDALLGDFGLCRECADNLYSTEAGKLPIKWMALESLSMFEFSPKSDIWSYGIFLYEAFSVGDVPYVEIQTPDMLQHLLLGNRLDQPSLCPESIWELMKRCWLANPNDRPTFSELKEKLCEQLKNADNSYGYIEWNDQQFDATKTTPNGRKKTMNSFSDSNDDDAESCFQDDEDE